MTDGLSVNVNVTDFKWLDGNKQDRFGYKMNRILYTNLHKVPELLADDRSIIGIVSGSGDTRIGKTVMGFQIAYFVAWRLAGGVYDAEDKISIQPTKPVKFKYFFDMAKLKDEIATSKEEYQVFVLDEGDAGAGSRNALSKKNREFRELIIRSALKKYFLIIIAPDYFGLSNSWAVDHSRFLINVYTVKGKRGYFDFYDKERKADLYNLGKKRSFGSSRYRAVPPNYRGTFSQCFCGDFKSYEGEKEAALLTLNQEPRKHAAQQRDIAHLKYYEASGLTIIEAAKELGLTEDALECSLRRAREILGVST